MQAYARVFLFPPLLFQREHPMPTAPEKDETFLWPKHRFPWAAGNMGDVRGALNATPKTLPSGHIPGHFSTAPPSWDTFKETLNEAGVVRSRLVDFIKNQTTATSRPHPPPKIRNNGI